MELVSTDTNSMPLHTSQHVRRAPQMSINDYRSTAPCEETPLIVPSSHVQPTHRRPKNNSRLLGTLLVVCTLALGGLFLSLSFDGESELSFAKSINVPMLGSSRKSKAERFATIGERYLTPKKIRAPEGCEATIMLVRHCDKGRIREHCDYVGYERAVYLATLFGDGDERWPAPSFIYALAPGGRHNPEKHNYREVETVEAIAEKLNLDIDDSYEKSSRLAKTLLKMLRSGKMCGRLALVNWKHSDIPHLAHKLGCGPTRGCPLDYPSESFGQVWQIKFVYKKLWHSTRRSGKIPKDDRWMIFGSVQNENFDPLSFSKKYGDYKPGGTNHGARWTDEIEDTIEASREEDEAKYEFLS